MRPQFRDRFLNRHAGLWRLIIDLLLFRRFFFRLRLRFRACLYGVVRIFLRQQRGIIHDDRCDLAQIDRKFCARQFSFGWKFADETRARLGLLRR